ncbi:hypothetical protein M5E87_07855 [Flavonifractor plautii]|nr:hypothetical protein M5E87_07855 [Flavonifractor plautii]
MIPKERLFEGIVSTLSVEDNIALSNAKQMAKGPFVSGAAVRRQAKHWIGELRIKTPGPRRCCASSPAATSRRWYSPGPWPAVRTSCCSTTPPAASMWAPRRRSTP